MKRHFVLLLPGLIAVCLILTSYSGTNSRYPGGAPSGYTGSPGDGHNCTSCHGGNATQATGWITSTIPAEGYIPGNTYTITVNLSGNGKKGFEVSPQDMTGALLGTLSSGSGNKLVGSGKYVTHSASLNSNPASWSFSWTAPNPGVGNVTFYGAFTVSEPVTKLSALTVSQQSFTGKQDMFGSSLKIYPNPVSDRIGIDFYTEKNTVLKISLIDLSGNETVVLDDQFCQSGQHTLTFVLQNDLPAGLHLLRLEAGTVYITRKIMIQK